MKLSIPIVLGAVLAMGCAVPAVARSASPSPQYQSDQQLDRERSTEAYKNGYAQGQADGRANAQRNDEPTSQFTNPGDQQAYRQGYDAGYENIMNTGRETVTPGQMPHGANQAEQFGYQDGLAAGRHDRMKGNKFKPTDHDLYKSGTHGWTSALGTKDEFRQLYREGFTKGYDEGYRGTGPK